MAQIKTSTAVPELQVVKIESKELGPVNDLNRQAIAQLIVSLQSNQHRATASTKNRGEVAGSTRKPWRQKGTGRARVGSIRTPLWRGGGRVFGPTSDRNYQKKINKQLLVPAIQWLLSKKADAGLVEKVQNLSVEHFTNTKTALRIFGPSLHRSNLLVIDATENVIKRVLRNVSYINLVLAAELNLIDLAKARHIIFSELGLKALRARFKKQI